MNKLLTHTHTHTARNWFSVFLIFFITLFMYSCSEQALEDITQNGDQLDISLRSELSINDFFDSTPCGNIVESDIYNPLYCDTITHVGYYSCDLYPECEFRVTIDYMVCDYPISGLKGAFVNQPEIKSPCEAFISDTKECIKGECNEVYEALYNCIRPQIENEIWITSDFELSENCLINSSEVDLITWLNATCSTFKYQLDIFGNMHLVKTYCSGTGCCFRSTFFCKDENGNIIQNTTVQEMDGPISGCPSEISDPSGLFGYTECVYDCEL